MKVYKRESDNFEVQDALDRDLEWVEETYGGGFVEVDMTPLPPTTGQIMAKKEAVIDNHIEEAARARGYGRVRVSPSVACVGYAGYPNPYQAEAQAYVSWMASLWPVAYQIGEDVQAGIRSWPTDEELIAELPLMVWPA